MKHSIRVRFTVIFLGVVAAILLVTWGLNTWGLESFYRFRRVKDIENAYAAINSVVLEADANGTTIISGNSNTEDYSGQLKNILDEYSDKYNITIAIIDSSTNQALFSSERGGDYLLKRVQNYMFDQNALNSVSVLVKKNNYSVVSAAGDNSVSSEIECFGYCDDNETMVVMSTPVANLKESVFLSNRFLGYVGLIALLAGMLIIFFMTKQVTKPILKLADLSEKMGKLDLGARYDGHNQDEIGILGNNMNTMAGKLEETITELKNANRQLQEDIKKKEEIDEMRKDFTANVSHELKTPIALIQGYAEGLNDGLCEDEESRKYYSNVIMDEAGKMNTMVKQLLTLSELETGDQVLTVDRFDLTELICGVIHSTRILAEDKKTNILFERSEPLFVLGDEFKIEEVITNYISNAIHHVNENGEIRVRTEEKQSRVRVEVFNSGSKIPDEDLPHIWDKFYKVDKAHSRVYGGTGIGLSIVQAVMDAHHMPYGAENTDEGVIFWFELDTGTE